MIRGLGLGLLTPPSSFYDYFSPSSLPQILHLLLLTRTSFKAIKWVLLLEEVRRRVEGGRVIASLFNLYLLFLSLHQKAVKLFEKFKILVTHVLLLEEKLILMVQRSSPLRALQLNTLNILSK
jgi:hypothetical protein